MDDNELTAQLDGGEDFGAPTDALRGPAELSAPDELDLAADREDRLARESQTPGQEEPERFAYTAPDGTEVEGTLEEIAEKLAEAIKPADQTSELLEKVKSLEARLTQEHPSKETPEYKPIEAPDYDGIGPNLETILAGGDPEKGLGGPETLGREMSEFNYRAFMTDERYLNAVGAMVNYFIDQNQAKTKSEAAFKEEVGADFDQGQVKAYMESHPGYSEREARLGLALQAAKSGNLTAEKKARSAGEKETLRNLKAKGTLRRIGGTGVGARTSATKVDLTNENQRVSAWADAIQRMRQTGR